MTVRKMDILRIWNVEMNPVRQKRRNFTKHFDGKRERERKNEKKSFRVKAKREKKAKE